MSASPYAAVVTLPESVKYSSVFVVRFPSTPGPEPSLIFARLSSSVLHIWSSHPTANWSAICWEWLEAGHLDNQSSEKVNQNLSPCSYLLRPKHKGLWTGTNNKPDSIYECVQTPQSQCSFGFHRFAVGVAVLVDLYEVMKSSGPLVFNLAWSGKVKNPLEPTGPWLIMPNLIQPYIIYRSKETED